jgi:1-acyl-sn-glycerol-3-phosphate acyltransferase
MYVPPLGPRVPRRGNALSRTLGRGMLKALGWRFEGSVPDEPKFVIIVAPHTSNWDFFIGWGALFALGFRVSFLAKHTVFKWPLGIFMRWLGGIPVERSISKDRVSESIRVFNSSEKLILAVAPEGTRALVPAWKTGFYYVADGAKVPIIPVAFDFGRKVVGLGPPIRTTGRREEDMVEIKKFFIGVVAKHPENFSM